MSSSTSYSFPLNRIVLPAERFDAKKALEIGLIHELAMNIQELDEKITDILNQLLASSPLAMVGIKRLLAKNRDTDFQELRKYCIEQIAAIRTSPEGKEGLDAFLEKRSAAWKLSSWKGNFLEKNTK